MKGRLEFESNLNDISNLRNITTETDLHVLSPSINPKIVLLKQRLINFHLAHIKFYESSQSNLEFRNFRSKYINKIRNELEEEFFPNSLEKSIQMLINFMQVIFPIFVEIKILNNVSNDYFEYFFYTACFIIIKVN